LQPAACTRTRISPDPGSGSERSSTLTVSSATTTARVVGSLAAVSPRAWRRYLADMGALAFVDYHGEQVVLDGPEAVSLLASAGGLEAATVSACRDCRSRVLAAVALVDLLELAPVHPRAGELVELADDAPTLHLYLVDAEARCRHRRWRDPGREEWLDAVAPRAGLPRRP